MTFSLKHQVCNENKLILSNLSTLKKNIFVLLLKFPTYIVNNWHHVLQLSTGEHWRQDVPHGLPPLPRHHGQHVHEVLVRLRVGLDL